MYKFFTTATKSSDVLYAPPALFTTSGRYLWNVGGTLVSRSIITVLFVASATASSSRSDDDTRSVISWRRSDKENDAVPPPPFELMGIAGDLCVARHRRCAYITSSSLLDLPSQAPSANVIVFMERDTLCAEQLDPKNNSYRGTQDNSCLFFPHSFRIRHLRCLPHSRAFAILTVPASHRLAPTSLRDKNLCIIRARQLPRP